MYSYEIDYILKAKNYIVSPTLYIQICNNSQIEKIKYNLFDDCYEIWSNDNYYWKIYIKGEKGI